jgi:hypothetical protein
MCEVSGMLEMLRNRRGEKEYAKTKQVYGKRIGFGG